MAWKKKTKGMTTNDMVKSVLPVSANSKTPVTDMLGNTRSTSASNYNSMPPKTKKTKMPTLRKKGINPKNIYKTGFGK